MHPSITRREQALLLAIVLFVGVALVWPAMSQQGWHSHAFADTRSVWGIPCAFDVLSNLPFAGGGVWGLLRMAQRPDALPSAAMRACAALFFTGLLCTAVGSSVYHWHPDDLRLVGDRAGMAVAFAGVLGLAACDRVSGRAGVTLAATSLVAALAAVGVWYADGNVIPWAVVQFGGMAIVLALAFLSPLEGAAGLAIGALIACYAVAKLLELGDGQVLQWAGGLVSGHSLKHVAAAFAAWPVLRLLARTGGHTLRHNAPATHTAARKRAGHARPEEHTA